MIDDERLAEIERRCGKARPGPWGIYPVDKSRASIGAGPVPIASTNYWHDPTQRHDFDFIVHARRDVPDLAREVRRLREEIDDIHKDAAGPSR